MAAAVCSCCHRGPRTRFDALCAASGELGACTSAVRERSESRQPLPALAVTKYFFNEDFVAARINSHNSLIYGNIISFAHSSFQDRAII